MFFHALWVNVSRLQENSTMLTSHAVAACAATNTFDSEVTSASVARNFRECSEGELLPCWKMLKPPQLLELDHVRMRSLRLLG